MLDMFLLHILYNLLLLLLTSIHLLDMVYMVLDLQEKNVRLGIFHILLPMIHHIHVLHCIHHIFQLSLYNQLDIHLDNLYIWLLLLLNMFL